MANQDFEIVYRGNPIRTIGSFQTNFNNEVPFTGTLTAVTVTFGGFSSFSGPWNLDFKLNGTLMGIDISMDGSDTTLQATGLSEAVTERDIIEPFITTLGGGSGSITVPVYIVYTFTPTEKTTPVDADTIGLTDSAASSAPKRVSWANLKATLKTYFDTLYVALTGAQTIAGVKTFSSDPIIPDEAYDATAWNGVLEPPTKNAVRDKIEDILDGVTFTGDVVVPDEAYGVGWNGSLEVPTKNAVYDKIETVSGGGLTQYTPADATQPGSLYFAEDTDNGTNKVTITVPASIASDKTVTFQDATGTVVLRDSTDTLTNKSVDLANNTVTTTLAQLNTAISDGNLIPEAGGTFTGDISVPDEAYDATNWNGSVEVPTKNAVRDKIESLLVGSSDSFKTIVVSGQSDVVADSSTDTLTLVAGSNVTITTNAGTDTITIASSGGGTETWDTIFKTSDEARTNAGTGTTLTDDGQLVSGTLAAASRYWFKIYVKYSAESGTPGFKFRYNLSQTPVNSFFKVTYISSLFTLPSTTAPAWSYHGGASAAGSTLTATGSFFGWAEYSGWVQTHATLTSVLAFQWAQNASSADDSTLYSGSHLMYALAA